jgi:hypothetical protein
MARNAEQAAAKAAASAKAERHIAAAIAGNRIPASRAAHWRTQAARGVDLAILDTLAVVPPSLRAAGGSSAKEDESYDALFGARHQDQDDPDPVYAAFFATPEEDRKRADAHQVAAANAAAALSDDDLYEALFGKDGSR